MNIPLLGILRNRFFSVDRLAQQVEHAPQRDLTHRHRDAVAECLDFVPAGQSLARAHHDTAHRAVSDVLRDFHHADFPVDQCLKCLPDARQLSVFKVDIDNRSGYAFDPSDITHGSPHFEVCYSYDLSYCP